MTELETHPRNNGHRSEEDRKELPAAGEGATQVQNAVRPENHEVPPDILVALSTPEAADVEIDFTRPPSYPRPATFD